MRVRLDIFLLQVWVRRDDVVSRLSGREQAQNRPNGDPHASDTWSSAHDTDIVSDPGQQVRRHGPSLPVAFPAAFLLAWQ